MPGPFNTTGRASVTPKPKPAAPKFQLFNKEQQTANAKAAQAIEGIKQNLKTASNLFRPKK